MWNHEQVLEVKAKQDEAVRLAACSPSNTFELSEQDVRIVCASAVPGIETSKGVRFESATHQRYWEEMRTKSVEVLTTDFIRQINNRRLLSDLL